MVGTSCGMLLGMMGMGRLLAGSEGLVGVCTLILLSFLFFLAEGTKLRKKMFKLNSFH